jgi:hypothetical protein
MPNGLSTYTWGDYRKVDNDDPTELFAIFLGRELKGEKEWYKEGFNVPRGYDLTFPFDTIQIDQEEDPLFSCIDKRFKYSLDEKRFWTNTTGIKNT